MSARVLVVDDDPAVREYAATSLSAHGFEVSEVASGEQALEAIGARAYDIVVLDKSMPGMDGIEVAQRMRELPFGGRLAILMLSGLDSDEDQWEGWRAGVDVYVTKPFDGDELVAHARRLLRLRAAG